MQGERFLDQVNDVDKMIIVRIDTSQEYFLVIKILSYHFLQYHTSAFQAPSQRSSRGQAVKSYKEDEVSSMTTKHTHFYSDSLDQPCVSI